MSSVLCTSTHRKTTELINSPSTPDIKSPIFFAICADDSVAPAGPSIKYARQAPRGVVEVFDGLGHFSIYVGDGYDRATPKYLQFLAEHLPVSK